MSISHSSSFCVQKIYCHMSIVILEMQHCWSISVSAKSTKKTTINCWRKKLVSVVTLCASYMSMCVHALDVVCFLSYSLNVLTKIKCAYFMCISMGSHTAFCLLYLLCLLYLRYISIPRCNVFLKDKANGFASECSLFSKWVKCKVRTVFPGRVESLCVLSLLFLWTDLHKPRCLPCLLMSA